MDVLGLIGHWKFKQCISFVELCLGLEHRFLFVLCVLKIDSIVISFNLLYERRAIRLKLLYKELIAKALWQDWVQTNSNKIYSNNFSEPKN